MFNASRGKIIINQVYFSINYIKSIIELGLDFAAIIENSPSSKGLMHPIPVAVMSLAPLPDVKETSRRNVPSIVNICKKIM